MSVDDRPALYGLRHRPLAGLLGGLPGLALCAWVSSCGPATETPMPEPDPEPEDVPPAPTEDPLPEVVGLDALPDEDPAIGTVQYTLTIGESEKVLLSGAAPASVWAFNGSVPGPLLRARVGETVRVVVTNNLSEETTIHWHGLRIDYRMDGVVHGGLVAIAPGETFTYEFVPPDAGTFWYHPHVRSEVQVERGLYGMLIVDEPAEARPDVDGDRALVLDDIRLNADGTIATFAATGPDIVHGRAGNVLLVNGSDRPLALSLAEGAVERWRLVNTANAREMTLRFPGLVVKEIGADGGLWPQEHVREVEEVVLPIGARAELEVRLAPGAAEAGMDSMVLTQDGAGNIVLAPFPLVEVSPEGAVAPEDVRLGHTFAVPPEPITARLDVDKTLEAEAMNQNGQIVMQIDGAPFPDAPTWHVTQGELQVIKVINRMPQNGHPFHLHGQFFQIVERDGAATDEPGWRDTVMIPAGAGRSVTVATYFDNPGMWMYHCHILEHAKAGMMAMVEVAPAE